MPVSQIATPGAGGRRWRTALVVAGAFAVLTLLVGFVGSTRGACSYCHARQVQAVPSAHAGVACYACHVDNGVWGLAAAKTAEMTRMYPAALSGRGLVGPARATTRASCLSCHGAVLSGITSRDGLRIKHGVCAPGPTCDTCHAATGHGETVRWAPTPIMQDCIACHQSRKASVACQTCHTDAPRKRTTASGPFQVIHGPDWRKAHGLGDSNTCATCHPGDFCVKCHKVMVPHPVEFGATHGAAAKKDPAACLVCHTVSESFCRPCHRIEMPHPQGFLKQHSKIAKGPEDASCVRCHDNSDCATCHGYHVHPGGSTGVPVPWTNTPERNRP